MAVNKLLLIESSKMVAWSVIMAWILAYLLGKLENIAQKS